MISRALRRVRKSGLKSIRFLLGDAHRLPFESGTFDVVFHVGGINAFRDRALALREMSRVAKPGAWVAVVDEQLDPARKHNLYHRAMFKMGNFYDETPHAPVECVPKGATSLEVGQVSRFFYYLRFRTPALADESRESRSP